MNHWRETLHIKAIIKANAYVVALGVALAAWGYLGAILNNAVFPL